MVRHLFGLLAGVVFAPLAWFGAGWAMSALGEHTSAAGIDTAAGSVQLGTLMAVGIAGGVAAGARVSPMAPLVSGVLLLGYGVWAISAPDSIPSWIPDGSPPHPAGPALPAGLLLGTLFFVAAMAPSRWRTPTRPEAAPPPPAPPVPAPAPEPEPEPAAAPEPAFGGERPLDPDRTTTPFSRDPGGGWSKGAAGATSHETREFRR